MNPGTETMNQTAPGHLRAGDILGSYQLLSPIAHGGMGQIWVGCRTGRLGLPRLVAIKTALPRMDHVNERLEELFFDEARVAVSIDHPNVCKTHELGEERNILFMVMEWVDGASLSNLVSAVSTVRRLDYALVAHVIAQACAGLHAAHELTDEDGNPLHVVHRDATPQNILISVGGDVKVCDFGVVKARNQAHQTTMTGELKGKISYLAPEQLLSKKIDRRTDIFALGCVLYYATTSKRAFSSDSAGETMLHIMQNDYVPPSCFCTDYPEELEAIIVRAMATDPANRFQTADEMRKALESFHRSRDASVGRDTLGALMQKTFGPAIEQRRAEIRAAQRLFESQRAQTLDGRLPPPVSGSFPVTSAGNTGSGASLPAAPISTTPTTTPGDALPTPRRAPMIALCGGIAALATGIALAWRSLAVGPSPQALKTDVVSSAQVSRSAESAAANSTAEAADARRGDRNAELVTITIRTVPARAMLAIDDGNAVPTPHTLIVPREDRQHQLQVRAPHYGTLTRAIAFDRSQVVLLELQGGPVSAPVSRTTAPAPARGNDGSSRPTAPAKPAESPKMTVDEMSAPTSHSPRPRRPIDESDPFRE